MANCKYCDIANDDESREYYVCESCAAEKNPQLRPEVQKFAEQWFGKTVFATHEQAEAALVNGGSDTDD